MERAMNLAEATHLLKSRDCTMHEHAAAGAYVVSYYDRRTRPMTRDSAPRDIAATTRAIGTKLDRITTMLDQRRRNRDQQPGETSPATEYVQSFRSTGNSRSEMGERTGSVGPVIVARLPGYVTQYSLGTDGTDTVLWRHSDIDGGLDPGKGNVVSTQDQEHARLQVRRQQVQSRRMAKTITDFWTKQRG
jgi:hypothetical protein